MDLKYANGLIYRAIIVGASLFSLLSAKSSFAVTYEEIAHSLFERLSGTPILKEDPRFKELVRRVAGGALGEAAKMATEDPNFTQVTMRHFATPMSNQDGDALAEISDFIVTLMMAANFDYDFRRVLHDDIVFTGNPDLMVLIRDRNGVLNPRYQPGNAMFNSRLFKASGASDSHYRDTITRQFIHHPLPTPSYTAPHYPPGEIVTFDNQHYLKQRLDFAGYLSINGKRVYHMVPMSQKQVAQIDDSSKPDHAISGVLSSRGWAAAHLSGGTNRRAIQYVFKEFLCTEIDQMKDALISSEYIRRDVDRKPGGSAALFQADCRGCHAGLDPLTHVYFSSNYNGSSHRYVPGRGDSKVVNGSVEANRDTYPNGYVPQDESWVNLFTQKQNARFGWRGPTSGYGLKEFGQMIANSRGFSSCMAKRVFKQVCNREPESYEEDDIENLTKVFEGTGYNIRRLFEKAAILPRCLRTR